MSPRGTIFASSGTLTVFDSLFADNVEDGTAVLYISSAAGITMENSTFLSNTGTALLFTFDTPEVTLDEITIDYNLMTFVLGNVPLLTCF